MKVFGVVTFLVLLSLADARPLKFDVPLIEVTPAVYTKAKLCAHSRPPDPGKQ